MKVLRLLRHWAANVACALFWIIVFPCLLIYTMFDRGD